MTNHVRTLCIGGAFSIAAALLLWPAPSAAYCTLGNTVFSSDGVFDREILVYVNDGQVSVARTGLPVSTVEQLVRSAIAAYNESAVTLPRLVYAGRVQNDTVYRSSAGQNVDAYRTAWETANPGKPMGIVIQAMSCVASADDDENVGAIAEARTIRDAKFSTISFTPYQDDSGKICPRGGQVKNCLGENAPIPPGACLMGDTEPCDCSDGSAGVHLCNAKTATFDACRCSGRGYEAYNIGDGSAVVGHGDCDDLQPQDVKDFQGVLTHELGHVLGLDHASITSTDGCKGSIDTDGNGETAGIMTRSAWVGRTGQGRRLRRDDMRAFDLVYESANWSSAFPLASYESTDDGATWTGPSALGVTGPSAAVRPSLSSAVEDGSSLQVAAWVGSDGSIWHATRDSSGWKKLKEGQARLPDALGANTRDPVAVAYGEGKVAIAWIVEGNKDYHVEARWAIRNATPAGSPWTTGDLIAQLDLPGRLVRKDLGLGYDLGSHKFVLTAIRTVDHSDDREFPDRFDGKLWMISIDPSTAQVVAHDNATDAPVVHAISKPACHLASANYFSLPGHCAVLASPMRTSGAVASALYFSISQAGYIADALDDNLLLPAVGYNDIAVAPNAELNQRFVGSVNTQGAALPEFFATFRTMADLGMGPPAYFPYGMVSLTNSDIGPAPGTPPGAAPQPSWPTAVGSRIASGKTIFTTLRAGSACSDGIKSQGEECDDGNKENGDGCSDSCKIECTPGEPGCRCLDTDNPGEDNQALPYEGIFGDGRYCNDDVSMGGQVRCLELGGESICHACISGNGVWCPCIPQEGCFPAALDGPVNGDPGDTGVCEAACDPAFPDICDASPAGGHGYCFVDGQNDPMAGGRPSWFFDQYCENVHSDLTCVQAPGEARMCTASAGPACL